MAKNEKKRHILNTRTKTGNRLIAACGQNTEHSGPPVALRNITKDKIETHPKGILDTCSEYYTKVLETPIGAPKTGDYYTKINRPQIVYPFEHPDVVDPFKLTSPASKDQEETHFMFNRMIILSMNHFVTWAITNYLDQTALSTNSCKYCPMT